MIGPDGGFLDGSVHACDLAVGPRMARLGEPVIDVILCAGEFKGMGAENLARGDGLFDERDRKPAPVGSVKCVPLSVSTVCAL